MYYLSLVDNRRGGHHAFGGVGQRLVPVYDQRDADQLHQPVAHLAGVMYDYCDVICDGVQMSNLLTEECNFFKYFPVVKALLP